MEHTDLQAGLRDLNESLGRMRSLRAWAQLKEHEARADQPPSFQIYDPTPTDLKNEYSHFLSTSNQVRRLLHRHGASLPAPVRSSLLRRLTEFERQARQFNLPERWPR
jgi:hypothetical protein